MSAIRNEMRLAILIVTATMLVVGCASPFVITRERLDSARPDRLVVTSVRPMPNGAEVVAYAFTPASISGFLRRIEATGATELRLREVAPHAACGRRVIRAVFWVEGDTSELINTDTPHELGRLLGLSSEDTACAAYD